jgi:hypothetical protein
MNIILLLEGIKRRGVIIIFGPKSRSTENRPEERDMKRVFTKFSLHPFVLLFHFSKYNVKKWTKEH